MMFGHDGHQMDAVQQRLLQEQRTSRGRNNPASPDSIISQLRQMQLPDSFWMCRSTAEAAYHGSAQAQPTNAGVFACLLCVPPIVHVHLGCRRIQGKHGQQGESDSACGTLITAAVTDIEVAMCWVHAGDTVLSDLQPQVVAVPMCTCRCVWMHAVPCGWRSSVHIRDACNAQAGGASWTTATITTARDCTANRHPQPSNIHAAAFSCPFCRRNSTAA